MKKLPPNYKICKSEIFTFFKRKFEVNHIYILTNEMKCKIILQPFKGYTKPNSAKKTIVEGKNMGS